MRIWRPRIGSKEKGSGSTSPEALAIGFHDHNRISTTAMGIHDYNRITSSATGLHDYNRIITFNFDSIPGVTGMLPQPIGDDQLKELKFDSKGTKRGRKGGRNEEKSEAKEDRWCDDEEEKRVEKRCNTLTTPYTSTEAPDGSHTTDHLSFPRHATAGALPSASVSHPSTPIGAPQAIYVNPHDATAHSPEASNGQQIYDCPQEPSAAAAEATLSALIYHATTPIGPLHTPDQGPGMYIYMTSTM